MSEHWIPCPVCGKRTEVSPEVHHGVPLSGMDVRCWSCGSAMTIPPTAATVEADDHERTLLGVAMIAAGATNEGKAILATTRGAHRHDNQAPGA